MPGKGRCKVEREGRGKGHSGENGKEGAWAKGI